jgi:hypothetical protein
MHRKYTRLKRGGGQAYGRSADLTAVSECLNKLRYNLLPKPTLTEILCIPCINVTRYSAVTKGAQSP